MSTLVLKSRAPGGRAQCELTAKQPCQFWVGAGGDWQPEGFQGRCCARVTFDGLRWRLHPLVGTFQIDGKPTLRAVTLRAPCVISLGTSWLIVDSRLEPGVTTHKLDDLIERHAARFVGGGTAHPTPAPSAAADMADDLGDSTRVLDAAALYADMAQRFRVELAKGNTPAVASRRPKPSTPPAPLRREPEPVAADVPVTRERQFLAVEATVVRPQSPAAPTRRARRWARVFAVGAMAIVLVCILSVYHFARGQQAAAAPAARRAAQAAQTVSAAQAASVAPSRPARTAVAVPPRPDVIDAIPTSPKLAADALIRGERAEAAALYRSLSQREPKNAAYATIATVLERQRARQEKP